MPKYDLDALGHEGFERMCQSLVQQIFGPNVNIYGAGSDGAREATFSGKANFPSSKEQWDGEWIFQVKFHNVPQIGQKKARSVLLSELEEELIKITQKYKHSCDNYILMTNVSLSPPFLRGTKDIIDRNIIPKYHNKIKHIRVLGAEEIIGFLDAYPGIRQSYAHLLISGDIIAKLMGFMEWGKNDLSELVKLYCQGCYDHERSAALDDAGDVEDKPVALQRVFIDLDVKPQLFSQQTQMHEGLPLWLRQSAEDDERKSALSYLLDDSILGLCLSGVLAKASLHWVNTFPKFTEPD